MNKKMHKVVNNVANDIDAATQKVSRAPRYHGAKGAAVEDCH
jgi:hypothetical protein